MTYGPAFIPRKMPKGSTCGRCGVEFALGDHLRWTFTRAQDKTLIHAYRCLEPGEWEVSLSRLEWPKGTAQRCPVPQFTFVCSDATQIPGTPTSEESGYGYQESFDLQYAA